MKKFFKYSLYGLIYIVIIFFFAVMFIVTAKAELIKPSSLIQPHQVVKIQLTSLMNNNEPKQNNGIKQTWKFAHPNNQKNTGPLERFMIMLKGDSYKMLLDHLEHNIVEVELTDNIAIYDVKVLSKNKVYYKLNWQVEKYEKSGILKDCWLTTMVAAPVPLGSSI